MPGLSGKKCEIRCVPQAEMKKKKKKKRAPVDYPSRIKFLFFSILKNMRKSLRRTCSMTFSTGLACNWTFFFFFFFFQKAELSFSKSRNGLKFLVLGRGEEDKRGLVQSATSKQATTSQINKVWSRRETYIYTHTYREKRGISAAPAPARRECTRITHQVWRL